MQSFTILVSHLEQDVTRLWPFGLIQRRWKFAVLDADWNISWTLWDVKTSYFFRLGVVEKRRSIDKTGNSVNPLQLPKTNDTDRVDELVERLQSRPIPCVQGI